MTGARRYSKRIATLSFRTKRRISRIATHCRCCELSTTKRPPSNAFALGLDTVLFILFVLLRTPKLTGLPWHEWLGVAFFVPMLVHLLLSWRNEFSVDHQGGRPIAAAMAKGGAVKVVLAPSRFAAAARSLLLLGAMLLVAAIMLVAKGPPQSSRDVRRNEIARFAPEVLPGVAQLGGQLLLVVVLTWACRGPLKIRL